METELQRNKTIPVAKKEDQVQNNSFGDICTSHKSKLYSLVIDELIEWLSDLTDFVLTNLSTVLKNVAHARRSKPE